MTTVLPLLGAVGAALFVVTFVVDGATRPGYDPVRHPVSALALGARGWLQTGNFMVSGLLIAVSAIGIHQATRGPWLAALVAVFGLALVASGAFPMDPMRGYPPGTPDDTPTVTSRRHALHDWAGMFVFGTLPVCAAIAAFTLDGVGWTVACGVVAVYLTVAFGRFGTAWEDDDPRTGLVQRTFIVPGWAWLGALCWHLAG